MAIVKKPAPTTEAAPAVLVGDRWRTKGWQFGEARKLDGEPLWLIAPGVYRVLARDAGRVQCSPTLDLSLASFIALFTKV